MATPTRDPFAATADDQRRARTWVERRGGALPPSRLVTARLAARHLSRQLETIVILGLAVVLVLWAVAAEFVTALPRGEARGPIELAVFYTALAGATWWVARRQRRAERRIAAALPRRTAHSRRRGAASVVGAWYLGAVAVIYGGGIALGVRVAVAPDAGGPALGIVLGAGALAMGLICAGVMADAVRRPALAADAESLAIDDLLRTEDAHRIAPFPLAMAVIAAVQVPAGSVTMWTILAYAAAGALLWTVAVVFDQRRTVDAPSASPLGTAP